MQKVVTITLLALLVGAGVVLPARAQVGEQGSITGTVADPQGAVLPGVTVSAVNTVTNVTRTAVTTESGVYLVTGLVTGTYKVTFTIPSFRPSAREIEVRTGERLRVDIKLELGGLTDEIKVVAETPLLTSTSASRSTIIDSDKVANTPLNGRNPFLFVFAAPGVLGDSARPSISYRPFDNGGMDGFNVNGGVGGSNRFLLDGAPNTNSEGGGSGSLAFVPSPDAVQEVRVDTNTYDAQFGRTGGGTISVSVKSGTNRYTGTAAYLHREKSLNQNLYQNILNNVPKTELFHSNPVFTIGGPVRLPKYNGRNRTFFFYNYEFLKSAIPDSANLQRAPTDLERAGDFSQSINGVLGGNIIDPFTGQPFPGNRIPASRIDPISATYLDYMLRPNVAPDPSGNNFIASPNSRADVYNSHLIRIDQNFGGNLRFFSRLGYNTRHEDRSNSGRDELAVTGDGHHYRRNGNVNADLTWTMGPAVVANLKLGWTRHIREDKNIIGTFDSSVLGLNSSYLDMIPRKNFFHPITVTDYSGAALGSAGNGFGFDDHVYSASQTFTRLWGQHQLKFGGEAGLNLAYQSLIRDAANVGAFSFTRNYTSTNPTATGTLAAAAGGNAFASFLLGYPRSQTITLAATPQLEWTASYYAAYVQDDWRINNRLTLNIGLRYDFERPVSEKDNLVVGGFDATSQNPFALTCAGCAEAAGRSDIAGNRADGGAGLRNMVGGLMFADGAVYDNDSNNIGPRVGLSFRLGEKALLRGGYGRNFLSGLADRSTTAAGNTRATAYNPSITNNATPASNLSQTIGPLYPSGLLQPLRSSQGLATNVGAGILFHTRARKIQAFDQFSAEVQYQLPFRSVVTLGYVGSQTLHRPITLQLNDLTPAQLALGDTFLNAQVPNPFAGLLPGSSFNGQSGNNATIQRRQLLRPYPQFDGVSVGLIPEGKLWYNSFQAQWEKRLSRGVSLLASYTFSESWELADPLNQGEARYEQLSNNHRPHALRLNGNWNTPSLEGHGAWTRRLLGNWQVGAVANIRSGAPVGMPDNVDVIGDYHIDNPTRGRWFNTCTIGIDGSRNACADPGLDDRAADPGRAPLEPAFRVRVANSLDTTGSRLEDVRVSSPALVDMTMSKFIRLSPRLNSQLRLELYNILGGVQFGGPTTAITNFATFGTVSNNQANDPRFIMLNFKLMF
jgi:hypothetical protein